MNEWMNENIKLLANRRIKKCKDELMNECIRMTNDLMNE